MENLTICCHECRTFPEVHNLDLSDSMPFFCWEPNLENLYLCNKDSVYELNMKSQAVSPIFSLKSALKNTSSSSYVVGLAYLSSLESLCVAVSSGELFTVERHFREGYQEQLVASAGSIKIMEWSPSHDTLAVLTNEQQLLVMSADFDLVAELDIQTIKASEEFVSVGWGKEETQFKGSVGKKVQSDATLQDLKLVNVMTSDPIISWRGDGQLFSVNFVKLENQSRCVSIFNRNGELLYSNCNIPGLENSLAWRPSGNFIAVTQRLPNKHQVCFVEKNTLKHSTFDVPFAVNEIKVKQLCWSADSKILLLWCVPQSQENAPAQFPNGCCELFLLFSSYNYHWYLKQQLDFTEQNRPLSVIWDVMSDCRLHVFSVGGRYDCFDFDWAVNDSKGLTTKDGAFVALIDNARLNLTCFRFSVIPPPMSTLSVPLSSTPRQVMFAPPDKAEHWVGHSRSPPARGSESFGLNPNDICVILSDGSIATLTYQSVDKFDVAVQKFKWECEGERRIQDLHHWVWISSTSIFCCASVETGSCLYHVKIKPNEDHRFVFISSCIVEGQVVAAATVDGSKVIIQTKDGQLFMVDDTVTPYKRLPDVCRQLAVWQGRVFGLSKRCRLYIDGHLVGDNITSLAFHSRFFLITTSRHRLVACYFSGKPIKEMITEGVSNGIVAYGRRVERGSRIVNAISEDTRVILSLPRGNLECIQPRALTLDLLVRFLEKYEYREAFELARKQRIDLNILCDQDPPSFFRNVDDFVRLVNEPEWLSLFLSELRDEDVSATMYEPYFKQPRPTVVENKVLKVCTAIRKALRNHPERGKFSLPIISSFVHTRTPNGLERALGVVKELKKLENDTTPHVSWSAAFKHILYLTDVDRLLQTALGMYDFDLVLLVASKSDKDPKEYLAFLNELNKMEPTYQRFSIDKHLQRWQSALKHLISTGPAYKDELVEFVKEHSLYNEALKRITPGDDRYEGILKAYADCLSSNRLFEEAGAMFRQLGDHRGALVCHTKALIWRECIIDICNIDCSEEEEQKELIQLATTLSNAKQHITAGLIHECHLNDPESAVSSYMNGHGWQEAITVVYKSGKISLLDTILPKVEEHEEYLLSRITSLEETFSQREQRLQVVRSQKLVKWITARSAVAETISEESDLFSDSSSVSGSSLSSTGSTAGTGSTGSGRSKNRRKHERKILSLKEDNPYEEGALVYALHNTITSAFELRSDVNDTCRALIHFNKLDCARPMQEALASLLTKIDRKSTAIWPPRQSFNPETGPNPYDEMAALEPVYQFAPTVPVRPWESALLKKDEVK